MPLDAAQTADRRITGRAFTAFGFTTWKIVCLPDVIIFVRTPWYAGIPAVLLSVAFAAVPLGTCRATLSGKNTMLFGSIVFTVLALFALAAVVTYCSRRARAWTEELARAPASQLRDHPDAIAFDVASVRALRFQKSNELWIDTTTGSHVRRPRHATVRRSARGVSGAEAVNRHPALVG